MHNVHDNTINIANLSNVTDAEFDALVTKAMDELPKLYIEGLQNIVIVYADEPTEDQLQSAHASRQSLLLGLYEGIPLVQRGAGYQFVLPDKITLFKGPLMAISSTPEQFYEELKRTLWHEIAHYYGLSHADMDRVMRHKTGHE